MSPNYKPLGGHPLLRNEQRDILNMFKKRCSKRRDSLRSPELAMLRQSIHGRQQKRSLALRSARTNNAVLEGIAIGRKAA